MKFISSSLESIEQNFNEARAVLEQHQFTLGGNWEYSNGSFDRALDESHKVWLRIPFDVVTGYIDSETTENDATIRLGKPYVLKHIYQEGNDPEASIRTFGAMFDQFQSPSNPDAPVEDRWITRAKQAITEVEGLF
ncbi:YugN family protein [Paenibacillus sp. MCAF20]